jgi:hypothetical protein
MTNQFELQVRRRLWYCIALIDTHASFDRGTLPMIHWEDLGPPPLYVNDNDISPGTIPKASSPPFNDMSFFSLMVQAMATHKKIMAVPDNAGDGFTAKLQMILAFEQSIEQEYSKISEAATPLEKFAQQAAKGIIASMHLGLRRPPYKHNGGLVLPEDDFDILRHATYVLEQDTKKKSPEFSSWSWKSWVQWHALAIVLVELCCRHPTEEPEWSYSVAVESFRQYSSLIADSEKGMLWKPIEKLMHRLQQLRANRVTAAFPKSASLSFNGSHEPIDQICGFSGVQNAADFTNLISPDLHMMDNGQHGLPSLGSSEIPGEEVGRVGYDDTDFDWSKFMDYVNMEYTSDFPNEAF